MDFAACAAQFREIQRRAESAAEPCAVAMAEAFKDHVSRVTLRRYGEHSRYSRTPSPPGSTPAMVSGALANSFVVIPEGGGGGVGRAAAGPTVIYAAVQEFGATIGVRSRKFLMWKTDYPTSVTNFIKSEREGGGLFLNFARSVTVPGREYMERGTEEAIPEIESRKIAVFMAIVWGGG